MKTILYVHGMGGGVDSRIPGILKDWFSCQGGICSDVPEDIDVVVRTYSFDPEAATSQLRSWVDELHPSLVIGESLGACHAVLTADYADVPVLFVSPSLNAPLYLGYLAPLALIPGVTPLLDHLYRPKPGNRQTLHFDFRTLRKYRALRRGTLAVARAFIAGRTFAFFGTKDHYRRSGVVSVRTWRRIFGDGCHVIVDGTHFLSEEHIHSLLIPKILEFLSF